MRRYVPSALFIIHYLWNTRLSPTPSREESQAGYPIRVPKMFFPTSLVAYNWFPLNVTHGAGNDQATLYAVDAGY